MIFFAFISQHYKGLIPNGLSIYVPKKVFLKGKGTQISLQWLALLFTYYEYSIVGVVTSSDTEVVGDKDSFKI